MRIYYSSSKVELIEWNSTDYLLRIEILRRAYWLRKMNMELKLSFTERTTNFSFTRLWKNLRMIHKMFIPPCSIVQRIFHGTLTSCILHHIKLSSASAFGASSHLNAQRLCHQQFPVPEDECALQCITQFFLPLLQVTWEELNFVSDTHTHTHLPRSWEVFFRVSMSKSQRHTGAHTSLLSSHHYHWMRRAGCFIYTIMCGFWLLVLIFH